MNLLKHRTHEIPFSWFILLPLLGVFQKIGVLLGWLTEGSWLNFILLLVAPIVWGFLILQRTKYSPFNPLLLIGGTYGLYMAMIEFVYWLMVREPFGSGQENGSFDDFYNAINDILVVIFRLSGNILLGLLIGAITGFIANQMTKRRQTNH